MTSSSNRTGRVQAFGRPQAAGVSRPITTASTTVTGSVITAASDTTSIVGTSSTRRIHHGGNTMARSARRQGGQEPPGGFVRHLDPTGDALRVAVPEVGARAADVTGRHHVDRDSGR